MVSAHISTYRFLPAKEVREAYTRRQSTSSSRRTGGIPAGPTKSYGGVPNRRKGKCEARRLNTQGPTLVMRLKVKSR